MAEPTTATIQVEGNLPESNAGFLSPDVSMLLLTWVTFFLLVIVLYKLAWRPILAGLDAREQSIKKSVDDVERIRQELLQIDDKRKQILAEAESASKDILAQARKGAVEQAKMIQDKAKEDAHILVENARREIKEELERARADLRAESAQIAVELAGKLLDENLDDEKNRRLIDDFIKKI